MTKTPNLRFTGLVKAVATLWLVGFSPYVSAACDTINNQIDYRLCLSKEAEKLEQEVQVQQRLLQDKIESWDQDSEFRDETTALFEKAKQSFAAYKAQQCDYEFSAAASGNGGSSMAANCVIRLNKEYLNTLILQTSWFQLSE